MRLLLVIFLFSLAQFSIAQKYADLDASPMDLATFKKGGETLIKTYYSRPQKKDRQVFGKLVKYGKVWRLGANENTEITFNKDVIINNVTIAAGTYSIFAIPNEKEWTIIINKEINKWGHFFYNEKDDVVRISVPVSEPKNTVEAFSMTFDKSNDGATLFMAWDNVQVALPIQIID